MGSTTKSRKVKRKRGKKFVWREGEGEKPEPKAEANLFESVARQKFKGVTGEKDIEKRVGLVDEFKNRGKNSEFVDKRIAEKATGMTEDDKMKLRYLKEQRNQAKAATNGGAFSNARKRAKFNLSDSGDSDGEVFMGFTHKGKLLDKEDDFNEQISESESDGSNVDPRDRGKLNEEVVNNLNFGRGGEVMDHKKTRKEVFQEIIEKSRAFNNAKKQVKEINQELKQELDDDLQDVIGLLKFENKKNLPDTNKDAVTLDYNKLLFDMKSNLGSKAQPVKENLTNQEQAKAKKQRLLEAQEESGKAVTDNVNEAEEKLDSLRKRDKKDFDKREVAIERFREAQKESTKQATKADNAAQQVLGKRSRDEVGHDSDLESGDESGYDSEDDSDGEGSGDDDEDEGDFEKESEDQEESESSVEIVQPKKKKSKH